MKRVVILLLLMLLTACGRSDRAGVEGEILIKPACPGEGAGQVCPTSPYQASLTVIDRNGREVARAESDSKGYFKVAVPTGEYTLMPQAYGLNRAPAQVIRVEPDRYVRVTIQYVTG